MSLIQAISDHVRESLGNPVRVRRFLGDHPAFKADLLGPADDIAMERVPAWQRLGQDGWGWGMGGRKGSTFELMGWRSVDNHYGSFTASCPALSNLVRRTEVERWACDLQDIHGFAASKSKLEIFSSTDEMVQTNSPEMIQDISAAGLRQNLAHDEIRLLRDVPTDWLEVHQWDRRMYVVNDGGSHHLAAAKYIAARIEAPVPLIAPLRYYSFDEAAVALLRATYDVYLVKEVPELASAFHDAMKSAGATWLWQDMPKPYENTRAIFLPRTECVAMRVSEAFREAGYVDLGQHLEEVARSGAPEVLMRRLHEQHLAESEGNEDNVTYGSSPRAY
jgi:hypothetical protein